MDERWIPLELPSLGKAYIDNKEGVIEIRTLKGKDEKLLSELTSDNFEKKFCTLLENTVKGIDVKELTLGDRFFILIWQRINSYSKDYEITTICPFCNSEIIQTVDLSLLDLKYLSDTFEEPHTIKICKDPEIEGSGVDLKLRLLRVKDEIEAVNYEKKMENGYLYRMALSIVDDEKNSQEKLRFVEELSSKDTSKIRAFHEKHDHGVEMDIEIECSLCGRGSHTPLPFRIDLVLPTAETIVKCFGDGI